MFNSERPSRYLVGVLASLLVSIAGWQLTRNGSYGLTVFAIIPFFLGGIGAWAVRPRTVWGAMFIGALSIVVAMLWTLVLGLEGLYCILMVLPLGAPIGALGGLLVHTFRGSRPQARSSVCLLLIPFGTFGWDATAPRTTFAVRTSVEIAAAPEVVWKNVVSFSDLPEPREWYFRDGLAYPMRARITGSGPGAVRYCEFSTGPFVEPIDVWNEPSLLRFRVTENPAPMHEWSPYQEVLPRHLHGYLVSKQGQFRLTSLSGNRTLLEGTTWYQHGLRPEFYWRWWSDAIIHRIHLRVLRHIKTLSEKQ